MSELDDELEALREIITGLDEEARVHEDIAKSAIGLQRAWHTEDAARLRHLYDLAKRLLDAALLQSKPDRD